MEECLLDESDDSTPHAEDGIYETDGPCHRDCGDTGLNACRAGHPPGEALPESALGEAHEAVCEDEGTEGDARQGNKDKKKPIKKSGTSH